MAQKGDQLDQETFSCSICLEVLKDPVTIPCGHSYCMNCINNFWDEGEKKIPSCPQCRRTFTQKPELVKNTMLAALVEQLKKTELRAPPADHCYAGPGDVACDFCYGRKLKAVKSCLACLASYCQKHFQPHHDSSTFKTHKLVDPSKNLQDNICPRHDTVAAVCQSKLKGQLQKKHQHVFEGIIKAGKTTLLEQIYMDLTEGGTGEVNEELEVRQIEAASRKPDGAETTIRQEDIFKPPPGRGGPIRMVMTKGVAGIGKTVLTQKFSLDWAEGRTNQDIQFLLPFTFRELNVLSCQAV
ncbi:E3 ubiquitin-protein ligase TRIM65-like [Cololabis saira]|uniref:E3 ubiquitin-protein ligase TRIM65-like n=1 Tax=Cololabis saira TaxID=129043 RepID=UPI002AD32BA0|nr:E3 ubiquitin-protein ligase TRIM65-like [Cololabis saira]